ncbi:polymeric immunoglobulin receptor-like [Salmo trutta]|uniref:polymeric immunoglobulin receptor-like n=1 Tax=Salmo trutta TaxID=8032 RepID=UPI0011310484|nr:polymeric immunoglobulin receptor-like [Salmo trutta]
MNSLLIVILLSFTTGCLSSFKVTGYSGGTVIIYCHYSTEERSDHQTTDRQDEGTYWCGVDKPTIPDSYTEVELDVKEDDCCEKSVTETAYLGGEATIRCNYPEDHEDSIKYFCKESNDFNTCIYMIFAYQTTAKAGRFSVSDNTGEKSYTVTISDLTEDDTGTYWCGVVTSYISLITQVQLHVTGK